MAELSTNAKDPLIAAFFTIEMQGAVTGVFKSLENIGSENELTEYKASGPKGEQVVKYQPGLLKWNAVTLKQGVTDDLYFWDWRSSAKATSESSRRSEARRTGGSARWLMGMVEAHCKPSISSPFRSGTSTKPATCTGLGRCASPPPWMRSS